MTRFIAVTSALLLAAGLAAAQEKNRIDGGIARRLADVLGDVQVDEDKGIGLADLAAEIDVALIDVDPDRVAALNDELAELQRQERDLLGRLDDLEGGLPVVLGADAGQDPVLGDVSESALELARAELQAQQLEITRLERIDKERVAQVEAKRAARRPTPLSVAMLATLEEIPEPMASGESKIEEPTSEFPLRIARAHYVSGDFIGALRQFRQVPEDLMTTQGRYEMARCLEETAQLDEALKVLDAIIAATAEGDDFWKSRAAALKRLIESSRNMRALTRND